MKNTLIILIVIAVALGYLYFKIGTKTMTDEDEKRKAKAKDEEDQKEQEKIKEWEDAKPKQNNTSASVPNIKSFAKIYNDNKIFDKLNENTFILRTIRSFDKNAVPRNKDEIYLKLSSLGIKKGDVIRLD